MKRVNNALLALIAVVLLALPGTTLLGQEAKAANSTTVFLQKGEPVHVVLLENVDSGTAKVNQPVSARIAEDVLIGSVVVITKDTLVSAHVSQVTKAPKRGGNPGKVEVAFDDVKAVNGRRIPLEGSQPAEGKSKAGEPTLGLFRMPELNHGTEATISKDTSVIARVQSDMNIDLSQKIPQ